ncbi:MAG: hypothetical protein K0S47_2562 [Herbinix sp.]|jgi:hypothetical protein|nr:hypothetical protein [Herbinix sp.]
MKRKRIIRNSIIILIVIIFISIINHDGIQFFYYYLSSHSTTTKEIIERDYNMQEVTTVMQNKNNHLYEGIENDTLRKKYIIKLSGKGVYTLYADEGVDISKAQIIAEYKGFPSTPINFDINDSFSKDLNIKDYLYWYVTNNQGKTLYITFNGAVTYSN